MLPGLYGRRIEPLRRRCFCLVFDDEAHSCDRGSERFGGISAEGSNGQFLTLHLANDRSIVKTPLPFSIPNLKGTGSIPTRASATLANPLNVPIPRGGGSRLEYHAATEACRA